MCGRTEFDFNENAAILVNKVKSTGRYAATIVASHGTDQFSFELDAAVKVTSRGGETVNLTVRDEAVGGKVNGAITLTCRSEKEAIELVELINTFKF